MPSCTSKAKPHPICCQITEKLKFEFERREEELSYIEGIEDGERRGAEKILQEIGDEVASGQASRRSPSPSSSRYVKLSDTEKRQTYDFVIAFRGKGKSFRYDSRDAEDIFSEFFGTGFENWDGKKSYASGGGENNRRTKKKKAQAVETQLACSLEELYPFEG